MSHVDSPDERTSVERTSDRELTVTRTFDAPVRIVYAAWTTPDIFKRWWAPRSFGLTILSCAQDVRTEGTYRLEIAHPSSDQPMVFFGRYIEVVPFKRIVWTNEEAGDGGAVTTVTFEERDGKTIVVLRDLYPSKEALDEAIENGSTSGFGEQFGQLDVLLAE